MRLIQNFPDEPWAKRDARMEISELGEYIDGNVIKSMSKNADESWTIIAESKGVDGNDNKPCTFKFTYVFGKNEMTTSKEVMFDDSDEWILRNEYKYVRTKK